MSPKTTLRKSWRVLEPSQNAALFVIQGVSVKGSFLACGVPKQANMTDIVCIRFGYVDFETIAAATKAIESLNQQLFEGRRITVQYAAYASRQLDNERSGFNRTERENKPLNPPSKTLFIGNMSFEMTDRDLNALFKGIKNVIDVRVAIDRRTGQPRGFAHADFIDVKSAMEAIKLLETKETYGRKLRLDFSYGPNNSPKNQPGADGGMARRGEQSRE